MCLVVKLVALLAETMVALMVGLLVVSMVAMMVVRWGHGWAAV